MTPTKEEVSPRYPLAVTVAQYAELLRHSPWAQGTGFHDILQHAVRLTETLGGDPDVIEFASLVSRTAQISGQ